MVQTYSYDGTLVKPIFEACVLVDVTLFSCWKKKFIASSSFQLVFTVVIFITLLDSFIDVSM